MQSLQGLRSLAFVERDLIEERAVRFVKCRATADVKTMVSLLAEEAVYTVPGDQQSGPCYGRHSGAAAIKYFLAQSHVEFQILQLKVLDVMIDGDRAVVRSTSQLRHRGTGASKQFEVCDVLRFENGYIVDVYSYVDTLALTVTRACGS